MGNPLDKIEELPDSEKLQVAVDMGAISIESKVLTEKVMSNLDVSLADLLNNSNKADNSK